MADDRSETTARPVRLMPVVAAALIDGDGRVLLQRRPPGKQMADLWEFPGGKIEAGETPEAALIRELAEELAIGVDPAALVPLTFASAGLGERHLLLLLYVVRRWQGEPRALEATALAWVAPAAMRSLAMPPADVPLVATLEQFLQIGG
jgi:8-oxo-dGTP diphosphatase